MISTEGTWRVGVKRARAGIFMPAHPTIGTIGYQEFYPGHAEDHYRILQLDAHVRTPAASSRDALMTQETTALEPGVVDHKYYIRGIGDVIERCPSGGSASTCPGFPRRLLRRVGRRDRRRRSARLGRPACLVTRLRYSTPLAVVS